MSISFFKEKSVEEKLVEEIFKISLVYYFIAYLLEEIFPGIVSSFLNLNYLLGIVILSGLILVILEGRREERTLLSFKKEKLSLKDHFFLFFLAALGSFIIFFRIKEIGSYAYLISIITFFILILVPYFVLQEED